MTAIDSDLTLAVERLIDAPRAAVWRCWTEPDLLKQWYCPKPWNVSKADIDPRPGGRANIEMQGPNGERIDCPGSYLEVVPGRRLVFTDYLAEGFVPMPQPFMTGFVELEDAGKSRTRMRWGARHGTAETMQKHLDMGFEQGWNAAADQLDALAREVAAMPGGSMIFGAKVRTCLFLASGGEEAATFYTSLLPGSAIDATYRPSPGAPAMVVEFTLGGAPYMILNGNPDPRPSHLASISVLTTDQTETDRLWYALTADGGEESQCGWLKDRFGIHWQIVPEALPRLMHSGDAATAMRVQAAMMAMRKIDIAGLEAAARGEAA